MLVEKTLEEREKDLLALKKKYEEETNKKAQEIADKEAILKKDTKLTHYRTVLDFHKNVVSLESDVLTKVKDEGKYGYAVLGPELGLTGTHTCSLKYLGGDKYILLGVCRSKFSQLDKSK